MKGLVTLEVIIIKPFFVKITLQVHNIYIVCYT